MYKALKNGVDLRITTWFKCPVAQPDLHDKKRDFSEELAFRHSLQAPPMFQMVFLESHRRPCETHPLENSAAHTDKS